MTGLVAVARLEVVLRFRAGRWRWLLVSWFFGLLLFSWLLHIVLDQSSSLYGHQGAVLFGGLQLFMLALALFIVPALTSQSINGDRERGRLSALQVTELTGFDIVAGKMLAAWATAAVFVFVSAPITIWAMTQGGVPLSDVVIVTLIMLLLLGIICAIGLGLSALLTRSTTSSVLTYVAVFVLAIGTVVLTGLVAAVSTPTNGTAGRSYPWYLAAPNPFVILADAAPAAPLQRTCFQTGAPPPHAYFCQRTIPEGDVLGGIRQGIRDTESEGSITPNRQVGHPVWPYGLAFDIVLAAVLLWAAVRSLATPKRRIPQGVRLA